MFFLIPLVCGLAVAERTVDYYNARKAKKYSLNEYQEIKSAAERNLEYKEARNEKARKMLEELEDLNS